MTVSISRLAPAIQTLFTSDAQQIARECGFVRRARVWTGPTFARTLVFGWMHRPDAALAELADSHDASAQSLRQRLTRTGAAFLSTLLAHAVQTAFDIRPATLPLSSRFDGVYAEDCTSIPLHDSCRKAFPACGGTADSCAAGLKVFLRLGIADGPIHELEVVPARTADVRTGRAFAELPPGSLRLADMGFFDSALLKRYSDAGVFWVSRLPCASSVRVGGGPPRPIHEFLAGRVGDSVDAMVDLGREGGHRVRVVARRCPPDVAAGRLDARRRTARRKGKPLSERQVAASEWTVLVTNLPAEEFTASEVEALPPVRWQVELPFEQCEGIFGVDEVSCRTPESALCQLLAELSGVVVANWALAMRGGPLTGGNRTRAAKAIRDWVWLLKRTLERAGESSAEKLVRLVARALRELLRTLEKIRKTKRKRRSTRDRLSEAESLS